MNDYISEETTRTMQLRDGAKLNQGEIELYFWQYNKAGSFMTKIFDAMAVADTTNINKISKGFPQQAQAYKDYGNLSGFWEQVKLNMESLEK